LAARKQACIDRQSRTLMFPPGRIVCLTEQTVETLYLLGEQGRIVGIFGYVVRPPQARRQLINPRSYNFSSRNCFTSARPALRMYPTSEPPVRYRTPSRSSQLWNSKSWRTPPTPIALP